MAVKRRVIWMSDEQWAGLTAAAKAQNKTVSQLVRPLRWGGEEDEAAREITAKPNPYTAWRPVPKSGKGR